MASLTESSRKITELLGDKSNSLDSAVLAAKWLIAASAGAVAISKLNKWPTEVEYVGAAIAILAASFTIWAEKRAGKTLSDARLAMDHALESGRKLAAAEKAYVSEIERLSYLQAVRDLVRTIFEDVALSSAKFDEVTVIDRMLQWSKRSLVIAFGFKNTDYYTICVYKKVVDAQGGVELVCVSHLRAIECEVSLARKWKEGVGAAGMALAAGQEVVVPDLKSAALGTFYYLPVKKVEDDARYRAIVAEPIICNENKDLWGVLVVTSSAPGHFSVDDRSYVDVAQTLAGMMSLGVKLARSKP